MLKRFAVAVSVLAAVLCLSIPAAAKTYTSYNGVMSIELPDDSWKEINDVNNWIVLSDGGNMITIDHISNGDTLPGISIADSHYVNIYQTIYSTQNEIFVVKGFVADAAKADAIYQAVLSAKVLVFNTKMPVKMQSTVNASDFNVVPMDETYYATADGINVRLTNSITADIIGSLVKGTPVQVTGLVQRKDQDYGWYRISYDGGIGYVISTFFSTKAPSGKDSGTDGDIYDIKFTGTAKAIYKSDGSAVTIYETADAEWYDYSGKKYVQTGDYEFQTEDGSVTLTANRPVESIVPEGEPFTVTSLSGTETTLTLYSDGYYYTSDWVRFIYDGGIYYGFDGSILSESGDAGAEAPSVE